MAHAYCSPADVREMTNAQQNIDLTDDQAFHFIRLAMAEIDSCCAGVYNVPFVAWAEPLSWVPADNIPPLIRTWCEKLASSYVMRELYIARAGKNQSPYGDKLFWEASELCRKMKNGEIPLLDTNGDPIQPIQQASDSILSALSRTTTPDGDDDYVMPNTKEPYPNPPSDGTGGNV